MEIIYTYVVGMMWEFLIVRVIVLLVVFTHVHMYLVWAKYRDYRGA